MLKSRFYLCTFLMLLGITQASASDSSSFDWSKLDLSENIELEPSFRYRFQHVDDNARGDADANTLKLRLTSKIHITDSVKFKIQLDHVEAFSEAQYNSVVVKRATSPIPEAPGTELNEFNLSFTDGGNWKYTIGRQSIGFDNERHVGNIEFWQKNQTFDAFRVNYNNLLDLEIDYVYLDDVQRIFGRQSKNVLDKEDIRFSTLNNRPASELGVHHHNSHLLHAKYHFSNESSLTGFAYLLENGSHPVLSSDTYGIRWDTSFKPDTIKYSYTLEYAYQHDSGNNPFDYATQYYLIEGNARLNSHQIGISHERFGQDNGMAFATSLGTNHKFQGWVDLFTDYQFSGAMKDTYLTYKGRHKRWRWQLVHHWFYSQEENQQIGNELDMEVAFRYNRKWEFKLIAAKYFADKGTNNNPWSKEDIGTFMLSAAYNL